MQQNLKVSVCMITYGHEKYIREAIEGVLIQECDFEVELILANDCSPDQTDAAIQDILSNHPRASWIKYIKHEKNLGMIPNFIFAMQQCKGEFIALCEGDDYWIDPLKLQKQVDFLEANPDYVIHSGAASVIRDIGDRGEFIGLSNKENVFFLENFYSQNNLVTCTILFRNCINEFPKEFFTIPFGDWFLYVTLLHKTGLKAYKSDQVYGVYRILDTGVMKSMSTLKKLNAYIDQIVAIKKMLDYSRCPNDVVVSMRKYSKSKLKIVIKKKDLFKTIQTLYVYFTVCHFQNKNV